MSFTVRASAWSATVPVRLLIAARVMLLLAISSVPSIARAADAKPAPALADTTHPALFLKETMVTGSRYSHSYFDSPQAQSFTTRKQLSEQRPTVLGDALYLMPGTDNSKDSPWEQRPVLRGLGGQRVLVMMDGFPVNSARGNGPHPSLVDETQVERIEVVRGPSSVAYGSDALGGVINIITRQAPTDVTGSSLRGAATIGGSSADKQANADIQLMPQIGRLSAFISAGGRNAQDFKTPDNGTVENSSFKAYNAIANLRYSLTSNSTLTAGWQLYRAHDVGIPGLDFTQPGFEQTFNFPYYNRNAVYVGGQHTNSETSWLASTSTKVYWQSEDRNFYSHMAFDNSFLGPGAPGPGTFVDNTDRYFKLDTYGLQFHGASRKFANYSLNFGVDAARDITDGTNVDKVADNDPTGAPYPGFSSVTESRSLPYGKFDNLAGYAQSELYVAPQWTLSIGARYTQYHYRTEFGVASPAQPSPPAPPPGAPEVDFEPVSVDNGALAGSAGLVYALRPDLHLSANIANGYRQPNAQELFFNGPASVGIVLGNSALKPEKSISSDVGLRWGPRDFAVSGNLFYSTYDDLIDAIQVATAAGPGGQATFQYVNISKARIWGGEAEGEWHFRPEWTVRASVTGAVGDITSSEAIMTLYGVNASSAPLPGVPPFKGNASLRWTSANGMFWVEPSTRYSWRTNRLPLPTANVEELTTFKKEWIVGDVAMGAKFGRGQRATVGVRNFTNRAFQMPLGSLEEPGVSVYGSLSTDF
jgi:hemoglobin/transferrin/lactoferrin receptor protein